MHGLVHKNFMTELYDRGIGVNQHYMPVYRHPYYQKLGFPYNYCKEAEAYSESAISLPIHPGLSSKEQHFVIEQVKSIIKSVT